MKKPLLKLCMAVALTAAVCLSGCKKDELVPEPGTLTNNENAAADVAAQFVDHTVAPTYTALAAKAELLASQLAALKANPSQSGLQNACETFLAAREEWEKSEAFLFGAAGDFGIDPHIDSWPLDEDAFQTLMNSPAMISALDADDGDVVAGTDWATPCWDSTALSTSSSRTDRPRTCRPSPPNSGPMSWQWRVTCATAAINSK